MERKNNDTSLNGETCDLILTGLILIGRFDRELSAYIEALDLTHPSMYREIKEAVWKRLDVITTPSKEA